MIFKLLFGLIFIGLLNGCHQPSTVEVKMIEAFNSKYLNYQFSAGRNWSGAYLNVRSNQSVVDTLALNSIYDNTVQKIKNDRKKSMKIYWVYLNVFDSSNDYSFTISKDQSGMFSYYLDSNYP